MTIMIGRLYKSKTGEIIRIHEVNHVTGLITYAVQGEKPEYKQQLKFEDVNKYDLTLLTENELKNGVIPSTPVLFGQVWINNSSNNKFEIVENNPTNVVMQTYKGGVTFELSLEFLHKYYTYDKETTLAYIEEKKERAKQLNLDLDQHYIAKEDNIANHIKSILKLIEPKTHNRAGLAETPARVEKAMLHWFGGYGIDPKDIFKTFEDGAEGSDQMVTVHHIPLYSKCEHHLADIIGHATVAYIPNGRIVGLSKINRVVDMFARRLQVQERLTNQIADCIVEHLNPLGVGVFISARHMCMESRGVCQHGHYTTTTALRGVIKDEPETRSEFMSICK